MTIYYLDTSAIAKRYLNESGSVWIRDIVTPSTGNIIVICAITPIEIFSAIERKESAGIITASEARENRDGFLTHYGNEYTSVQLSNDVLVRARHLVTTHKKLRTLDAIQLASAVEAIIIRDIHHFCFSRQELKCSSYRRRI